MTFDQAETMPVALSMIVVLFAAALATQRFIAGGLSMGAVTS